MQDTAIQAGAPSPAPAAAPPPVLERAPVVETKPASLPWRILTFCASLRLTCILFLFAFALVFFGTLAQVDFGIWTVVQRYFRSFGFMMPVKILLFRAVDIPDSVVVPFPGGWTIGGLLLVNLLAAHAVRFRFTWKRSGIMILHAGIIVMMLGEFFTGVSAVEGRMTIPVGYKGTYVENDRQLELVLVDRSDPKVENEVVIPGSRLKDGVLFKDPELPVDVKILQFMTNADLMRPDGHNPATTGIGLLRVAKPKGEVAGVDPNQSIEIPTAYVQLFKKDTQEPLGTYMVSLWYTIMQRQPDSVTVDGKKHYLYIRNKRSYRDYSLKLNKFVHDVFPGTTIPKDYRSFVRLEDKNTGEERNVQIFMNATLYYRGETYYQAGLHNLTRGTILQVVRNWSWRFPYISCAMVAGGMLLHFGMMLITFLQRQGFGVMRKSA